MQRAGFEPRMKNRTAVTSMSTYLLQQGLTTREVKARLIELYHVDVSLPTISTWARKDGVTFEGTKRLRPCRFCESSTRHKDNCPMTKSAPPRESAIKKFQDSSYAEFLAS